MFLHDVMSCHKRVYTYTNMVQKTFTGEGKLW